MQRVQQETLVRLATWDLQVEQVLQARLVQLEELVPRDHWGLLEALDQPDLLDQQVVQALLVRRVTLDLLVLKAILEVLVR